MVNDVEIRPATPADAPAVAPFVYDSAHELLAFMFGGRDAAIAALTRLLAKPDGHFGYRFATVLTVDNEVAGAELGYGRADLDRQNLPGTLATFRVAPLGQWPHLAFRVGPALSGYVPPPAIDAYYINNIAVDASRRGAGLGRRLLDATLARARTNGFRTVELDVTAVNENAIGFYRHLGFRQISTSGDAALEQKTGLPVLVRMRRVVDERRAPVRDNEGRAFCTRIVDDVTGLNPVEVDEVAVPGSVEQLARILRTDRRPVSIGGGRFSMGGQTASPGTLHIDLRGLNRVLALDPDARTVTVEAGARWKDVQRAVDDAGLAVSIMQTYSSFTVGGSLSVNCHGRYVGLGPLVLSVRQITLMRHDGTLVEATPDDNADIFYGAIGGYGALGIIVQATLALADNARLERLSRKMPLADYLAFFRRRVDGNPGAVFHNADMVPPRFETVRAITWQVTDKPARQKPAKDGRRLYLTERYMLWAITETPLGHWRREFLYEPLLYFRPAVKYRNEEADYDVAELEPLSRRHSTYVLQEYFVPPDELASFAATMAGILQRYSVQVVNVSIRHARPDPGTLLAWAPEEVFALVLYYKQGTSAADRERVGVWTRELIDAVLTSGGRYYLPYQLHARHDQFHAAYPRAGELKTLKQTQDPDGRFRNCLWDKYFDAGGDRPLLDGKSPGDSEFLTVYGDVRMRDDFYRFLQTVYHLYPEHAFHRLIIEACERHDTDADIYADVAARLPGIKPFAADLTYALPALSRQKREMQQQTQSILPSSRRWSGYLEIGSTGRYVRHLKKALDLLGPVYLSNEVVPDNSPPEIMERGGLRKIGDFFPLDDYAPIPEARIADESLDLVTCYIGLHHCPREKLDAYIASIHRVLRPGGHFVLRDHDAGTESMRKFVSLVHTVFNAGLDVSWEDDRRELRLFEGVEFWIDRVTAAGFDVSGKRLLQAHDPSLNTLLLFTRR